MLINRYCRSTLASPAEGSRMTCDVSLNCHTAQASVTDSATHVLVESKSANGAGQADRLLRRLGVRPISVSNYCVGASTQRPSRWRRRWAGRTCWPALPGAAPGSAS